MIFLLRNTNSLLISNYYKGLGHGWILAFGVGVHFGMSLEQPTQMGLQWSYLMKSWFKMNVLVVWSKSLSILVTSSHFDTSVIV